MPQLGTIDNLDALDAALKAEGHSLMAMLAKVAKDQYGVTVSLDAPAAVEERE
jgi:hypothetical protein